MPNNLPLGGSGSIARACLGCFCPTFRHQISASISGYLFVPAFSESGPIIKPGSSTKLKTGKLKVLTKSINSSTYGSIKRKNLDRVATLSSNVLNGYNADKIVAELKIALKDYSAPSGITIKFAGQQEDQQKEMAFLSTALMVAVFLYFFIKG